MEIREELEQGGGHEDAEGGGGMYPSSCPPGGGRLYVCIAVHRSTVRIGMVRALSLSLSPPLSLSFALYLSRSIPFSRSRSLALCLYVSRGDTTGGAQVSAVGLWVGVP